MSEPKVQLVQIWLCELCLSGKGGQCHVPGCALIRSQAPDLPIAPEFYSVVDAAAVAKLQEENERLREALRKIERLGFDDGVAEARAALARAPQAPENLYRCNSCGKLYNVHTQDCPTRKFSEMANAPKGGGTHG